MWKHYKVRLQVYIQNFKTITNETNRRFRIKNINLEVEKGNA